MNIKNGQKVTIHYVGKLKDGTVFDNSRTNNKPLSFTVGEGKVLPAFEKAVSNMNVGETKTILLEATEAYGEINPDAVRIVPKTQFGTTDDLEIGSMVRGQSPDGNPIHATVKLIENDAIILDFNHPLAGKNLDFEVELLDIAELTEETQDDD